MSYFVCPHCGENTPIFGEGGGQRLAEETGVPLLARIPLDPETRQGGDEGLPIVIHKPDSPQARAFLALAQTVTARLSSVSALPLPSIE
jgi:ATP-binding protein involved in chromosome partitioning